MSRERLDCIAVFKEEQGCEQSHQAKPTVCFTFVNSLTKYKKWQNLTFVSIVPLTAHITTAIYPALSPLKKPALLERLIQCSLSQLART